MEDVSIDVKRQILTQKLQMYKNSCYDALIDTKVAKMLEDEISEKQATERLAKMTKAVDFIEKELSALEGEQSEPGE